MFASRASSRLLASSVRVSWMSTWKGGKSKPTVAIAGVTGAVGQEILGCFEKRKFPFGDLKLLASSRSAGKEYTFMGKTYVVEELKEDSFKDVDMAIFSAGGSQSKRFAPAAAKDDCVVIDNSSAFRMDPNVPLVVPEVNPDDVKAHKNIIACPNCSTIIMNVVVWPLHQVAPVERIVVSTYQAASGAGAAAMAELEQQAKDWVEGKPLTKDIFGRQYVWNLFSHNSNINATSGYNEEEEKMIYESRKIFHEPDLRVTATCIRVPVLRAHSESVNVQFKDSLSEEQAREVLAKAPGVKILDERQENRFPEPLDVSGSYDTFVGRIRRDMSQPAGKALDLFIVGDQLLKGAALNAVQIAELLLKK